MNEWPAGWFRDEKPPSPGTAPSGAAQSGSAQSGSAQSGSAQSGSANEPTVSLPAGGHTARPGAAGGAHADMAGQRGPGGAWPEQPPFSAQVNGGQRYTPRQAMGPMRGGRGRLPGRRIFRIVLSIVLILLVAAGGMYFYLDSKLTRAAVLVDYSHRPAGGDGQNWLITGSDSRQGLTRAQERRLATGRNVSGHRSDTILILHIPSNGRAVLISLPRDSYVPIPGYGYNKINAAYSFGGAKLLAKTVQNVTGLRIEHYMGIGFGGLVRVVDAVGGVQMCLPQPIRDPAAGLHLKAGCQTLDGAQALGYVRTRHSFASQDLQRVQNQRLFLRALLRKITSPGTLLNPFAVVPAAFGSAGALTVDSGTHLYPLIQVAFALRNPETTTVPIANANYATAAGDAVLWDHGRAARLFNDLNAGRPVPRGLLTGSRIGG